MLFKRLRDLREDNDYSQTFIAEFLNLKQNSYSQIEKGVNGIDAEYLMKLSQLYHCSVDYILGLTDVMKPYPRKEKK